MKQKLVYKGKYPADTVSQVLYLLNQGKEIRSIEKVTEVPETTIRNWKFGYTPLFRVNKRLSSHLKQEALRLLDEKLAMPKIAQKLEVNYNSLRLFLRKRLPKQKYELIKASNGELPDSSKVLTSDLSYILGVMYGDGHFGVGQIRLGAKDKEFVDYFEEKVINWCGKKPSRSQFIQNEKPYYECYLSFKTAADFILSLVGKRQYVPDIIFHSNNEEILINFVKGFSDSEGTIITNELTRANFLKIYNQKIRILEQVKDMMCRLNFNGNKINLVVNNKSKGGDVYALRICYRDQLQLFYEKIGFIINRKQQKLSLCLKRKESL